MNPVDMTERKRWPNECEWARMDAKSDVSSAIANLNLAKPHVSDAEALRYISAAIEDCYKAKIALIEARGERAKEIVDGDNRVIYRADGKVLCEEEPK